MQKQLSSITKEAIINELWRRGELDYKMHSSQLDYKKFISSNKYIKQMLHCGRGWGKTVFFLLLSYSFAIKNPGVRVVYATQSRESVKSIVLPTFLYICQDVSGPNRPIWRSQDHCFEFSNGSRIVLEGADDDHGNKLRGAFAHMIICDEFGFWAHPKYVANTILLPQIQRARKHFPEIADQMKMYFVSTSPESLAHEFYEFQSECMREGSYFLRTIHDNPLLTAEDIEKYAKECGGFTSTMFRREYLCHDVVETRRAVIPEFSRELHTFKSGGIEVPKYRDVYISADFGFVRDYTHIIFGYYHYNLAKIVIEGEVVIDNENNKEKVTGETVATEDTLISERINTVGVKVREMRKKLWTVGDNEIQPHMMIADCPDYVLNDLYVTNKLEFFRPEKYDKEQAINNLRDAFLDEKILISEDCPILIAQCHRGIWNKRKTDYERLPGLGHLDGLDALNYFWRSVDRNLNPRPLWVNAPENNVHKYNVHMYDQSQDSRVEDLYD